MNQGMQEGGAVLVTTDDPYNASATTEVADYSNDLPVIDPPIPIPASQRVDFIPEQANSDARLHNPGGEVNQSGGGVDYVLEAPILADDVIRAGGLGARDELGSVLPAAMDATDFEASLRDAQQYEEDYKSDSDTNKIPRPGVGFVKDQQQKMDGFREKYSFPLVLETDLINWSR
ncbi:hypothetical protein R1sor_022442 [Riccia sorocarpa]|uniref:Uncharacterized protein n=1 Tax=Riccia sorocarpa TaxID=122646 RepID=A0ABD3GLL6_9MARC